MPTAHQPEREALLPVWYGFISHSTHVIVKGKDVQSLVRTGLSFYKNLTTFNDPLWLMFFFIISILTFTDTALGSTWNWSPTCWICRSKLKILKWIALLYCFWPCLASAIFFSDFLIWNNKLSIFFFMLKICQIMHIMYLNLLHQEFQSRIKYT